MRPAPIPLLVVSTTQDDVAFINKVLREAGLPAHCQWVSDVSTVKLAVKEYSPQLAWFFADRYADGLEMIARIKPQLGSSLPLIGVRAKLNEAEAEQAMRDGASDLVSGKLADRLCLVAQRELRAYRLEKALSNSLHSTRQYKEQIKAFMAGSADAIAYVQEGILVDANQAWADLFQTDAANLHGPLMDLFDKHSHAVLKGALVATMKGQWESEPLNVTASLPDGSALDIELLLESAVFDEEQAIKLSIPREHGASQDPENLVEQAVSHDATTGVFHRPKLLEAIDERLSRSATSGERALAYIRIDEFGEICKRVGPIGSEEVLVQLADIVRRHAHPKDIYGRLCGNVFAVWLERGTVRDIQAWAGNVIEQTVGHVFEVNNHSISASCTIGIAEVGHNKDTLEALLSAAYEANNRGREKGGNQVAVDETTEETVLNRRVDEVWVAQIKSALVENRFQLGKLSIANLNGRPRELADSVIRMIDLQGEEVPASTFIPVALRNNLIRAIDRWVIDAAIRAVSSPGAECLFIKLSEESIADAELIAWLGRRLHSAQIDASRICIQITEESAAKYMKQAKALAENLTNIGFQFAIEHFGLGKSPVRLLGQIPASFIKIDGSLMQSLADNAAQQARVKSFIEAANMHGIQTIAERVEDANTMAVLFNLGIGYVQGMYVQEPEVVLEDTIVPTLTNIASFTNVA